MEANPCRCGTDPQITELWTETIREHFVVCERCDRIAGPMVGRNRVIARWNELNQVSGEGK